MDFSWTEEQEALYTRAVKFGRDLGPAPVERDEGKRRERWARAAEFGLLGLSGPVEHGGSGLDPLTTARVLEGFGQGSGDTGLVLSASAHLFACAMALAEFGDDTLKRRLLPGLLTGRLVGANAITEAEAGSDSMALRARATRDRDDYVLDGAKLYVTNGPAADVVVVYASTNPNHGYLGVSAFLVETDRAGVKKGPPLDEAPLPSSPLGALYFDECRVPATHRLGGEGEGAAVFQRSMLWERSCLFGGYLGMMQAQLDRAVEFARTRRQFGRPIGRNQAVSHRIADMKQRLEAARLLLYRACWLMGRGESPTMEVALAKLAISEGAVQSSLDAMHLQGGAGVTSPMESLQLLGAVAARIFSGTSEIQRDLIARGLGLEVR